MDMSRCRELVDLDLKIAEAEATAKELKARRKELEATILDEWIKERPKNVSLAEGPTLTFRRDIHIAKRGGIDTAVIVKSLRRCGLEWLTNETYSAARLKAWLKEQVADSDNPLATPESFLPELLQDKFGVHESHKIVVLNKDKAGQ